MDRYPGQRLSFHGIRFTVKCIVVLPGKDGSWLCFEWDDDTKGKHDGTLDGHWYFNCKLVLRNRYRFLGTKLQYICKKLVGIMNFFHFVASSLAFCAAKNYLLSLIHGRLESISYSGFFHTPK